MSLAFLSPRPWRVYRLRWSYKEPSGMEPKDNPPRRATFLKALKSLTLIPHAVFQAAPSTILLHFYYVLHKLANPTPP